MEKFLPYQFGKSLMLSLFKFWPPYVKRIESNVCFIFYILQDVPPRSLFCKMFLVLLRMEYEDYGGVTLITC